jgi:hypothetical protein
MLPILQITILEERNNTMKRIITILALSLFLSACGSDQIAVQQPTSIAVPVETVVLLTINSPGSGAAQFVLEGLATAESPEIVCNKMIAANGISGHHVIIALIDLGTLDQTVITIKGRQVGQLSITDAEFWDGQGHLISGEVNIHTVE